MKLLCVNRGLLNVPVHEPHFRGKNWCARVTPEPQKAGGLHRYWFEKGRGEVLYVIPDDLSVGDVLEFGADYYTTNGKQHRARWYGYVTEITAEEITLKQCDTAYAAFVEVRNANLPVG